MLAQILSKIKRFCSANSKRPCSRLAVIEAIKKGDLEAIKNNHVIVMYLCAIGFGEQYLDTMKNNPMCLAISENQFEIFQYMCEAKFFSCEFDYAKVISLKPYNERIKYLEVIIEHFNYFLPINCHNSEITKMYFEICIKNHKFSGLEEYVRYNQYEIYIRNDNAENHDCIELYKKIFKLMNKKNMPGINTTYKCDCVLLILKN